MSHIKCKTINTMPAIWLLPGLAITILFWATLLWATQLAAERLDDTSIYIRSGESATSPNIPPPNILLILDTSTHMGDPIAADVPPARTPPPTGNLGQETTRSYAGQVDEGEVVAIGPFRVRQGSSLRARMSGTGNADLYVRQDLPPDFDKFDCRSVYPDSTEACELWSATESVVYVSVYGADTERPSSYQLEITHVAGTETVPPSQNVRDCNCEGDSVSHCGFTNAFVNTGDVRTICRDKLSAVQSAATDFIRSLQSANVGLMRFNGDKGGYIVQSMSNISSGSMRAELLQAIKDLDYRDASPFSEALFEAHQYLSGGREHFGYVEGSSDSRVFVDHSAYSGASYDSPLDNQCSANHVVMVTGSAPAGDGDATIGINSLPGIQCTGIVESDSGGSGNTCLAELAAYISSVDLVASLPGSRASIHTVGLGISADTASLFETVARKGDGRTFRFENARSLPGAFADISRLIDDNGSLFSAPAVTLNTYNRLQHRDDIYFAVFQPSTSPGWAGNIKKYRLSSSGDIIDMDAEQAVDANTGYFTDESRSYWSDSADGNDVSLGGFRARLPVPRTVYTSDASGMRLLTTGNVSAADLGLPPGGAGSEYTEADEDYADSLVEWALGIDMFNGGNGGGNRFVADSLHAQPIIVNYGCKTPEADGSCRPDNLDDTVYAATNRGFLHAIDAVSGNEHYSFIPRGLLKNLAPYAEPVAHGPGKVYGIDGVLTVLRSENPGDFDQDIEPGDGDAVLIYAGMRRGGSSYLALDVTDRKSPAILWQIDGAALPADFSYDDPDAVNALAGTADTGFEDLAQTWSAARPASINWGCKADGTSCEQRTVVVFTGGYDPRHDENTLSGTTDPSLVDEFGNAVYLADAYSGELLWSAGNNEDNRSQRIHDLHLPMTHSIPASPGFADTDGDGALDIIFVVDIAGGVWRIDFNSRTRSPGDLASGGMIFNLEEQGNFRRFYNRPDVVVNTPRGEQAFATLILGSGYRADPANTVQRDQIYVLFEDPIFALPGDDDEDSDPYNDHLVRADQLYQARMQEDSGQPAAPPQRTGNAPDGYVIPLINSGEKVLQPTLTLNNVVVVTTYLPASGDQTLSPMTCADKPLGSGRTYFIDIHTGESVLDAGFIDLGFSGIPAKPTLVFSVSPAGGTIPVICVGTECFGQGDAPSDALGTIDIAHRSYWRENTDEDNSDTQ